jgi:hypothetical protein
MRGSSEPGENHHSEENDRDRQEAAHDSGYGLATAKAACAPGGAKTNEPEDDSQQRGQPTKENSDKRDQRTNRTDDTEYHAGNGEPVARGLGSMLNVHVLGWLSSPART